MMNLKCTSLNIRGIIRAIKRRNLFRWLHNGKYDVIYFYKKPIATRQSKMSGARNGDETFSHGSKHSRGATTLIKPTVKVENIGTTCEKN